MTDALLERVVGEYAESALTADDPDLRCVQAAILIEDVFGVVLTDELIGSAVVGDAEALRAVLGQSTNAVPCAESAE